MQRSERQSCQPPNTHAHAASVSPPDPLKGEDQDSLQSEKARNEVAAASLVRKDLEAETGFAFYEAYSEIYYEDPLYPLDSGEDLDVWNNAPKYAIVDILKDEGLPAKVNLRHDETSATRAFAALLDPPKDTKVQVVLPILDSRSSSIPSDLMDVFGLALDLDPMFFLAYLDVRNRHFDFTSRNFRERANFLLTSSSVAFIARHYACARSSPIPIILVVGLPYATGNDYFKTNLYDVMRNKLRTHKLGDEDDRREISSGKDVTLYIRLLQSLMRENQGRPENANDLLLGSLFPLLHMHILEVRSKYMDVLIYFQEVKHLKRAPGDEWKNYSPKEDEAPEVLYRQRVILREIIDDLEDRLEIWKLYVSAHITIELATLPTYLRIQEDGSLLLRKARRLEAALRDYLQLQAGQLALLESRTSIELSNNQIQESKRVKIFTILAFIYIPLNLATSIFGMNIQQLNGSGRSLGDFIATAIVTLLLTGGSWWLSEQFRSIRIWRKRDEHRRIRDVSKLPPTYTIGVRLFMLAWLVIKGCSSLSSLMFATRAAKHILRNSNAGFLSHSMKYSKLLYAEVELRCAGHLVSSIYHGETQIGFDLFKEKDFHWINPEDAEMQSGSDTPSEKMGSQDHRLSSPIISSPV